jgi:hypothetical protein
MIMTFARKGKIVLNSGGHQLYVIYALLSSASFIATFNRCAMPDRPTNTQLVDPSFARSVHWLNAWRCGCVLLREGESLATWPASRTICRWTMTKPASEAIVPVSTGH